MADTSVFREGLKYLTSFIIVIVLAGCSLETPTEHTHLQAIELKEKEMLLLKSDKGIALLDFLDFADEESVSTYRWRFLPSGGGEEERGSGEVFERYTRRQRCGSSDQVIVKGNGSQTALQVGTFSLQWSYASFSTGWLYVDKIETKTSLLPDIEFEAYKLASP